jgi:hypothetical protein
MNLAGNINYRIVSNYHQHNQLGVLMVTNNYSVIYTTHWKVQDKKEQEILVLHVLLSCNPPHYFERTICKITSLLILTQTDLKPIILVS